MANIVITTDANCIVVEWNDMASYVEYKNKGYFKRSHLVDVLEPLNYDYVQVLLDTLTRRPIWNVSVDGAQNSLVIDSIDGVTPTDNEHLAQLIAGLILA